MSMMANSLCYNAPRAVTTFIKSTTSPCPQEQIKNFRSAATRRCHCSRRKPYELKAWSSKQLTALLCLQRSVLSCCNLSITSLRLSVSWQVADGSDCIVFRYIFENEVDKQSVQDLYETVKDREYSPKYSFELASSNLVKPQKTETWFVSSFIFPLARHLFSSCMDSLLLVWLLNVIWDRWCIEERDRVGWPQESRGLTSRNM